ncbi:MAG: hypothetical protein FD164_565 [Nitrospirae bacterium]|nr:MAG: hypothetical protein FD164_565 [Nitrospirota bacterium]
MTLFIREARTEREIREFIEYPLFLYRDDPLYSPQLTRDLVPHFTDKNPFFRHAEARYFLAYRDGKIVGRIASIINHLHNQYHSDHTGFFGFYESINDQAVADALLCAVEADLRMRGMQIIRGPVSFSTNEECGLLVEGFEYPSMLMTPYNKRYYDSLMKNAGYTKTKDLYAFLHDVKDALPEKVLRVAAIAEKRGIIAKQLDKKHFLDAMRSFRIVYNAAWAGNWCFVPITEEELEYDAARLKPLIRPDVMAIAFHNGEAVGFCGMVPDFNIVLRRMHGKTNPWTLLKALFTLPTVKDLRLLLLGIRPEYRNKGVDGILFREAFKGVKGGGYKRVEFSWILEDNIATIRLAEMAGSRRWKIFRIYEKPIAESGQLA